MGNEIGDWDLGIRDLQSGLGLGIWIGIGDLDWDWGSGFGLRNEIGD